MKKVISFSLVLLLLLSLFGCNPQKIATNPVTTKGTTSTTVLTTESTTETTTVPTTAATTLPPPTTQPTTKAPVPVPIEVGKIRVEDKGIGIPVVYIQFKNTGNKQIEAFDFDITCYDAYGSQIYLYGSSYSSYAAIHDTPLAAGATSSSDNYWALYGFTNTKTVEVTIMKYKLAGETPVTVNYSTSKYGKDRYKPFSMPI